MDCPHVMIACYTIPSQCCLALSGGTQCKLHFAGGPLAAQFSRFDIVLHNGCYNPIVTERIWEKSIASQVARC